MILTFYHGPTPEYPLPAIVGDITPEEWGKVKNGAMPCFALPADGIRETGYGIFTQGANGY